jgi:hypothetical protein
MRTRTATALSGLLALAGCTAATSTAHAPAPKLSADPVIVRLAGRDGSLTILSTGRGPAYSVADRDGKALLTRGNAADLARVRPELRQHLDQGVAKRDGAVELDASLDLRDAW